MIASRIEYQNQEFVLKVCVSWKTKKQRNIWTGHWSRSCLEPGAYVIWFEDEKDIEAIL